MTNIKAGIVSKLKFVSAADNKFSKYLDYIDRETATWSDNFQEFNLFTDYMDNDEKSNGLFKSNEYGEEPHFVTEVEKEFIKEKFADAQNNNSPLWQHVFSFDMQWLEEKSLYNSETGWFNEDAIMKYSQDALYKMFEAENFSSALSVSSIHYNTDHIHIHSAFIDSNVQKIEGKGRCYKTKDGKIETRCKFKAGSIEAGKRELANQILNMNEINKSISNIMREQIINNVKENLVLANDVKLKEDFSELISKLPDDTRLWKYGNNAMKHYRDDIDKLSDKILSIYYADELQELKTTLYNTSEEYKKAYGGNNQNYIDNKMKDLHTRLGNAILLQAKTLMKEKYRTTTKGSKRDMTNKAYLNSLKFSASGKTAMSRSIYQIKQAFMQNLDSMKNQAIYERMQMTNNNEYDR